MTSPNPKVTVLISTYNRPDYLKDAIGSVVDQAMTDWELLVINDGGVDVGSIAESFNDPRIQYFHREKNQGKAACCNFGLEQARGEYIAYIDDDDRWYPCHLELLSEALDKNSEVDVAYSDLYAVSFVKDPDTGQRYSLDKTVRVSRDFNRDFMFFFNHTLHVSVMHRRDLALYVGGYDENITVLIDWNLTWKMTFYTDFLFVPVPTGEYYMSIIKSDRISVVQRKDKKKYKQNIRRIKADHPPLPWPKVDRVAVILPVSEWDEALPGFLAQVIDHLSYPVEYLLVNNDRSRSGADCRTALGEIGELKNVSIVTPSRPLSDLDSYRFGARSTGAEYVFLITRNLSTKSIKYRLYSGLENLKKRTCQGIKWDVEEEKKRPFDVLIKRKDFLQRTRPNKKKKDAFINVIPNQVPESFRSDLLAATAQRHYSREEYKDAFEAIKATQAIKKGTPTIQFTVEKYYKICVALEEYDLAEKQLRDLMARGYVADNSVRLGRVLQARGDFNEAVKVYRIGLEAIGLSEADLNSPVFPFPFPKGLNAFTAVIGLGECFFEIKDFSEAARMFRRAAKLRANSHRPFLGFAKLFLANNQLDKAEAALGNVGVRDGKDPETHRVLGKLCERRKKPELAFSCYLKAFEYGKSDAKNIDPLYYTGAGLGKWEEMRPVLEEFLERRPDHVLAITRLSSVYYRLGEYSRAEELTGRGLALDNSNAVLQGLARKVREALAGEARKKPDGPAPWADRPETDSSSPA